MTTNTKPAEQWFAIEAWTTIDDNDNSEVWHIMVRGNQALGNWVGANAPELATLRIAPVPDEEVAAAAIETAFAE